ncbi:hypothetical protein D9615_000892 [Tricholomella constricta]|uniref:Succinate dehydrogenase [ubiquinone] cytochrome b small subunit n=1 Tax=Tricholomella constricta TaxID=117010 RepID=A0A8H5HKB5_9AGAR|nr:hypothetical protein D9615_000892 [Tricholomella constricta]
MDALMQLLTNHFAQSAEVSGCNSELVIGCAARGNIDSVKSPPPPPNPGGLLMASSLIVRSSLPRALAQRSALRITANKGRHSTSDATNATYIPGGPVYKGTVNDPTTFPPPSRSHGSYHWAFERLLSASLVPITAAAYVTSGTNYPIVDGLLGISLIMHSHIGFDSALVDYVHKRKFPILGPAASWALRATTVGVLVGVYQFNTNDIGLTELIAKVWSA